MHAAVEQHRAAIEELCRGYGVTQLDVFGSATRDDFDEATSDVDFLVEFEHVPDLRALRQYFGFKEDLEKLLGRPVDLVEGVDDQPGPFHYPMLAPMPLRIHQGQP